MPAAAGTAGPREERRASSPCRTYPGAVCQCPSTRGSWFARMFEGTGALKEKGQKRITGEHGCCFAKWGERMWRNPVRTPRATNRWGPCPRPQSSEAVLGSGPRNGTRRDLRKRAPSYNLKPQPRSLKNRHRELAKPAAEKRLQPVPPPPPRHPRPRPAPTSLNPLGHRTPPMAGSHTQCYELCPPNSRRTLTPGPRNNFL